MGSKIVNERIISFKGLKFHNAFCCDANKTMEMRIRRILWLDGDFQAKNNLFGNLITGDETWVHLNIPETKRDSVTSKHPSSQ
ncbi:hypothetical protein ElyMa_006962600 [Elysia marginata]|uniref:Transposase n=1 Tax=Elysia marginata TaxID=1093978 RepID=A0AAV4JKN6_9GAST|nr:hypothetical protein ElyMa_006962600 [Elysia marginata]